MLSKTVTSCVFASGPLPGDSLRSGGGRSRTRRLSPEAGRLLAAVVLGAVCLMAGPARAQYDDLPHLHSVPQAEAEAVQTEQALATLEHAYAAQQRDCLSRFFVTRCQEQARIAYNEEVSRLSLRKRQAELYLRRVASAERAQARDPQALERERQKALLIEQAEQAPPAQSLPPSGNVPAPDTEPLALPAPSRLPDPRLNRPDLDAAQRAQNVEAYQRRQQEAAEHAARVEEKRLEAELRRAQRREEREALAERLRKLQQERPSR